MLTLVNVNRMLPAIAPVGLEYVAAAARHAGVETQIADLGLADAPEATLDRILAERPPSLVGISMRNVDDCFWPSAAWFLPDLRRWIDRIRHSTAAPICLGGVGFSIFAPEILTQSGADFGLRGDGEAALIALYKQLSGAREFHRVEGLLWRRAHTIEANPPAWPRPWPDACPRDLIDNREYFRRGGQVGVETKRGCDRACAYCADPIAKGAKVRARDPARVADEFESLAAQGVDVLHICDSEFNIPGEHARAVSEELVRRNLGDRVRWYAYLAVVPFDVGLAAVMRRAGCVGINFTGDAADDDMLRLYRQPHRREDLDRAIQLCKAHGIAVMVDLLLGGPGETPASVAETVAFVKKAAPDCAGAALGVRLYPGTGLVEHLRRQGPLETCPGLRRRYDGPVRLERPTFYIAPALGPDPAGLVCDMIAGDTRFFAPTSEVTPAPASDHNYNENTVLVDAIAGGARGAYWDILRRLRT